jgi:hypothetical protein
MLLSVVLRQASVRETLVPLAGIERLSSACSSACSIPVVAEFDLHAVKPTTTSREVSESTTTDSGVVPGHSSVNLVPTV